MSMLEVRIPTMPETSLLVGSEGAIHVRENGGVRILTAEQARDLASASQQLPEHAEGRLMGGGV